MSKQTHYEFSETELFKFSHSGLVIWKEIVSSGSYFKRAYDYTAEELEILNSYDNSNLIENLNGENATPTYFGEVTHHARKRLSKALGLLFEISERKRFYSDKHKKHFPYRLAFQTLTLSAEQGNIPDSEIKSKMLKKYLRIMKAKGMKNYVWKAERQKNDNIHFHIMTDSYIDYKTIRNVWNKIQAEEFDFLKRFELKNGHRDPNSTDVKAVISEKRAMQYLYKYMLKDAKKADMTEEKKTKYKGKIWDCSANLKIKNDTTDFLSDDLYRLLIFLEDCGDIRAIHEEYYKIFFFSPDLRKKHIPAKYLEKYEKYLEKVKCYNN